MSDKPYKLARLVHHDYNISKRWYVSFWAWDKTKDRMVRRRMFEPMNRKGKTVSQRIRIAEDMIRQINGELWAGKTLGNEKKDSVRTSVITMSLLQAVQYVKEEKVKSNARPNYIKCFTRLNGKLELWLKDSQRSDFPLKKLTSDDVFSFFSFLQKEEISNKTFNNYKNDLSVTLNFLMKRNEELFKRGNPARVIDKLKVLNKKHAAYSDAQMKAILEKCLATGQAQLLLYIQFCYYTLGRPSSEIRHLKIQDIDIEQKRILFRAELSKNRRDEYIGISTKLSTTIKESRILDHPANFYVFGKGAPAAKPASYLYFYSRNRKILKALEYDQLPALHSLYSYKHSGAISLYKATKDIKLLMAQCRHTSLDQTDQYLRDLALFSDYEGLRDWDGAI